MAGGRAHPAHARRGERSAEGEADAHEAGRVEAEELDRLGRSRGRGRGRVRL